MVNLDYMRIFKFFKELQGVEKVKIEKEKISKNAGRPREIWCLCGGRED